MRNYIKGILGKMRGDHGRRGFTLIEMLVVVAIISILAGVVLTGVTGFQANARDTKRIADLKIVQNYLELYFTRHGHYPGTAAGAIGTHSNWESLTVALANLGVTVPNDPLYAGTSSARKYHYAVETAENLGYILGAILERENNVLDRPEEIDTVPSGFTTTTSMNCAETASAFFYCIGTVTPPPPAS